MAAPPVTLPAALNTWARGSALAARDIEHVHDRHLRLDARGLAPLHPLHLARYNHVELVVPTAFVLDGFNFGGCTVDLRQGDHRALALLLQVDHLRITPIDAVCIRLDLVLEHGLSHVVKRADSDVGGGVVLTHDGHEVPHYEEKFFDGATPLESVPVLRQRRNISPYLGKHAIVVKLDLVVVRRALGIFRYDILVVRQETTLAGADGGKSDSVSPFVLEPAAAFLRAVAAVAGVFVLPLGGTMVSLWCSSSTSAMGGLSSGSP